MAFHRTVRSGRRLTAFLCLLAAPLALAVLCTAAPANAAPPAAPPAASKINPVIAVDFKCKLTDEGLVCGNTKKKKKKNNNGGGDGASNNGEGSCGPGYVALDKPNKCGALCQPVEGDPCAKPAAPAEVQANECSKFPGMVGTYPDCTCPEGTDFQGYKGCVKLNAGRICQVFPRSFTSTEYQTLEHNFLLECVSKYKSKRGGTCITNSGPGQYADTCCCDYTY